MVHLDHIRNDVGAKRHCVKFATSCCCLTVFNYCTLLQNACDFYTVSLCAWCGALISNITGLSTIQVVSLMAFGSGPYEHRLLNFCTVLRTFK